MHSISTRAGDVCCEITGVGTPIFLLHATLHTRHDFDAIVPRLSSTYQTIAVDWPWHGDSSNAPSEGRPTADLFGEVLEEVVTSLNLPPAIFIGNSVGGFAAARLAIRHPERVKALILVNTGGFVNLDWITRLLTRLLGIPLVNKWVMPFLVWRYMAPQTAQDKEIATQVSEVAKTDACAQISASIWKSFLDPSFDLRVPGKHITAPTLLIWGKRDVVIPVKVGYATQRVISGSRLEILDAGHVVFASKPDLFLDYVEAFIREI
jgi:pimeloyl-ACP methyl ester carboxylesterase